MKLPDGFQFSQGSLQDFVDCRRRFRLRYLDRLAWPALQTEPALDNERHMHLGLLFHHMVHQHLIGIPVSNLAKMIHDEQLERWWLNFLDLLGSESTPLACLSDLESLAGIFPEYCGLEDFPPETSKGLAGQASSIAPLPVFIGHGRHTNQPGTTARARQSGNDLLVYRIP
jgi:hypothetical protein